MSNKTIGLKAGLEIHQQIDTNKLFCSCPSYLRSEKPDFTVMRRLHAVPGETGEVDIAVEFEASKNKEFVYEGYNDTTCLIELDEEPPHLINENALNEAIKIALLLNCELYTVSQIMRKTVINGSNTSGFQRTVLIAHDGFVETSFGKVGIQTLMLEEDAAREIGKEGNKVVFRLDRLGIPLVEIATTPELYSPEQIKECALKLGETLRACKVKRGIGTIRQDLNISIKGHDRVEIKGFQDPKMMIKTVELEVERQKDELKKGKRKGEVRGAKEDGNTEFQRPMPGEARMYPETDLPLLKISRERINKLKKELPKLKTEIKGELKNKGLSDELVNIILSSNSVDEFETLMRIYGKNPDLIAKMITLWRVEIANKLKKSEEEIKNLLTEAIYEKVLEALRNNKITEADVRGILIKIAEGAKIEDALRIEKVDYNKLEEEISRIIKEKPGLTASAYMGLVMSKLKGKIDARKAMEIINKIVKG